MYEPHVIRKLSNCCDDIFYRNSCPRIQFSFVPITLRSCTFRVDRLPKTFRSLEKSHLERPPSFCLPHFRDNKSPASHFSSDSNLKSTPKLKRQQLKSDTAGRERGKERERGAEAEPSYFYPIGELSANHEALTQRRVRCASNGIDFPPPKNQHLPPLLQIWRRIPFTF